MRRFSLSPKGPEVSAMAYGVWRLGDDPKGTTTKFVREKIDACLESGITTFDHADIYGLYTCEGLFGAALAESPELRGQMEIVTKCGIRHPSDALPDVAMKHYDATADSVESCVDRSLRELQIDTIDVLLIHRPDWLTRADDTAAGFQRVMDKGKVRSVGVSNYTTSQFDLIASCLDEVPVTNQVEVNLLHMDAIYDGTLNQCEQHDIHPMAWSPLAGGRIMTGEDADAVRTRDALLTIGNELGATPEQVALAWVAALPSQPQVVIGTNQPDRIRESADSVSLNLSRTQWYRLWEAAQGNEVP
jgi:predicted oxidoreductase